VVRLNESKYKQTLIGKFPKDWKVVRIEEIAETLSGGTPSRNKKEYYGGKILWVKSGELNDNIIYDTEERISEKGLKESSAKLFPKGTLLVAMYGATVGKTAILGVQAATNQAVCAILPKGNSFDPRYLQYYIIFRRKQLISISSGGAQPNISQNIIRSFRVALPSLWEQKRIAEVLSCIDDAIRRVDFAIAKTERLKRGLMQKLLTEGIGHKEFKETKIGKIPKTWKVVRLSDKEICEIRGNKSINKVKKVAFIPMELISDSEIFAKYEIRNYEDVKSFTYCEAGDLLLAKITPSLENGKQGIVPSDIPGGFALATTEVFPISCKGIDRLFLFYVLKFSKFRKILEHSMTGTTGRQRVPKKAVERLRIPLPPLSEQHKIAEILSTVDRKLELERLRRERLLRIKKGLMGDLLTGRRRVKVAM